MKITTRTLRYLPYISIAFFVLIALFLVRIDIGVDDIRLVVSSAGIFGPLVFIFLQSLTYIFAPLSGTPFFLSGFAMFGKYFILYTYFSTLIGMVVNFWVARIFGRRLVAKFAGEENIGKVDDFTKNFGLKTLVFLRLFQGNFADYISYAYGLTTTRFRYYIIVSALAPLPGIMVWWFVLFPRISNYNDFLVASGLSFLPAVVVTTIIIVRTVIQRVKKSNKK